MTVLRFKGVYADDGPDDGGGRGGSLLSVWIGGANLIEAVEAVKWSGPVTVAIADETFTGDLYADEGSRGYSEWTPGDPATLTVGPHDIRRILDRYEDQEITVWIADEPINTLDP